jgi:subtilisin family serine protease
MSRVTANGVALLAGVLLLTAFTSMTLALDAPVTSAAPPHAEGRILVKFKQGTSRAQADVAMARRAARDLAAQMTVRSRHFDTAVISVSNARQSIADIVKAVRKWPDVAYAEPDYLLFAATVPNDPDFGRLWGLENTGQLGGATGADIGAVRAWDIVQGDPNQVVAVIDSGVDYWHEDLADNMWLNTAEVPNDGLDNDDNGYVDDIHGINAITDSGDPMDDDGHGTHVAGTIGAVGDNETGVTGVNWQVQIMALKFLGADGSGYTSDAIQALDYAVQMKTKHNVNIRLVNASWGGGGYNQALADAIQAAADAGILFVAAAGNRTTNIDTFPYYPAAYDLPNIIAVASSDSNDNLSAFSNYGVQSVDLAAPGSSILSTLPNNGYGIYSGTSMATPHVTGAAGLLWAYQSEWLWTDVKQVLLSSAARRGAFEGKVLTGGRLDADAALNVNCDSNDTPRLQPSLAEGFSKYLGVETTIGVFVSSCVQLNGVSVRVVVEQGKEIELLDDGNGVDQQAGDGVHTASWTPQIAGPVRVEFKLYHEGVEYSESRDGTIIDAIVDPACPAEATVAAQSDRRDWLALLDSVRDDVLSETPSGRELIEIYYRHSDEVRAQLQKRPLLALRALRVLRLLRSDLADVAGGHRPWLQSRKVVAIRGFARSLKWGASPELSADLDAFLQRDLNALLQQLITR